MTGVFVCFSDAAWTVRHDSGRLGGYLILEILSLAQSVTQKSAMKASAHAKSGSIATAQRRSSGHFYHASQ